MLFTTHAIVGAALGSATGNPYAGFLLGVVSHHVLDAIPHFDQGTFYKKQRWPNYLAKPIEYLNFKFSNRDWAVLFLDWTISGIIFLALFKTSYLNWNIVIGALGGLLPDIIDASPLWSRKLREKVLLVSKYHTFHEFFHWTASRELIFIGIASQIIITITALLYLIS